MLSVGAIVVVTVALAFAVVLRETDVQLRSQLDTSIHAEALELARAATQQRDASAHQILAAARRFMRSEPYSEAAVLLFVVVPGHGTASNHPELVTVTKSDDGETRAQQDAENAQARRLSRPRSGYSTQTAADVGRLRVDEQAVSLTGGLRIYAAAAESLNDIDRAQDGELRSFAFAGALALLLALAFAYLTGTRISGPLRSTAQVAAEIDGGDLTPRIELPAGANRELQVLADAFNHMLDRLSAAFDAQTAFIADASHELRTPLTVIRGQLDLLAGSHHIDHDEVARVERLIQEEISRLTRLTDDLLVLARVDNADFLRKRDVDLGPFITDLWDGLSLTAERQFEVGPLASVTISADPDRLAQALRNLGANAIAHTEAPDGRVRIDAQRVGASVLISVSDDGPGIAAEHRQRVLERFYRTDPSRARSRGGTGLGLAIVRAMVEAHGGSVRVGDSALGGAGIDIELAISPASAAAPGAGFAVGGRARADTARIPK